jgi:hypothetical protein
MSQSRYEAKKAQEWLLSPQAWPTKREAAERLGYHAHEGLYRGSREAVFKQVRGGCVVYSGLGAEQPHWRNTDAPIQDPRHTKVRKFRPQPVQAAAPRKLPAGYIDPRELGDDEEDPLIDLPMRIVERVQRGSFVYTRVFEERRR